ncbi:MAG: hypothetical protein V3V08_24195 [Nannocystaceae bacterium]
MSAPRPDLAVWRSPGTAMFAPALVAAGWLLALGATTSDDLASRRALLFVGGPLLLMAGIHGRLEPYLHAPERARLLPLPLAARAHWLSSRGYHLPQLLGTVSLGVAALAVGTLWPSAQPQWQGIYELTALWLWLAVFALPCELLIAGSAAALGRRFPIGSLPYRTQEKVTGGWTSREAAVHLYAPALAVGVAVLLALPGQLSITRAFEGHTLRAGHIAASVTPFVVALAMPTAGCRLYRRGIWEAVAWLSEMIKTLAGPPLPVACPPWVSHIPSPLAQILILRMLRLSPFTRLRFVAVVGSGLYLALRTAGPTLPSAVTFTVVVMCWLLPLRPVAGQRGRPQTWLATLPLPAAQRQGRHVWVQVATWGPPVFFGFVIFARWIATR